MTHAQRLSQLELGISLSCPPSPFGQVQNISLPPYYSFTSFCIKFIMFQSFLPSSCSASSSSVAAAATTQDVVANVVLYHHFPVGACVHTSPARGPSPLPPPLC